MSIQHPMFPRCLLSKGNCEAITDSSQPWAHANCGLGGIKWASGFRLRGLLLYCILWSKCSNSQPHHPKAGRSAFKPDYARNAHARPHSRIVLRYDSFAMLQRGCLGLIVLDKPYQAVCHFHCHEQEAVFIEAVKPFKVNTSWFICLRIREACWLSLLSFPTHNTLV